MMGGFFPFGGMPKPKKDSWKKYVTNVTEEVKTHPEPASKEPPALPAPTRV